MEDIHHCCTFLAILTLSLALAGCGAMNHSAGSSSHGDLPTLLLVTRSGAPPDHLLPLFGGSTDAAAVQKLYRAMYALPRMPPGAVTSCPADNGVEYTLRSWTIVVRSSSQPACTLPAASSSG